MPIRAIIPTSLKTRWLVHFARYFIRGHEKQPANRVFYPAAGRMQASEKEAQDFLTNLDLAPLLKGKESIHAECQLMILARGKDGLVSVVVANFRSN